MKLHCSNQRNRGLTITEVVVVVATLSLLAVIALAQPITQQSDEPGIAQRIACIDNLKRVGLATRIWANDNGSDKFPQEVTSEKGGAKEQTLAGNVVPFFQVMSNELTATKNLICPADANRSVAKDFTTLGNSNISYFVGVDAKQTLEQASWQRWLSGDSNLAVSGTPLKSGLAQFSTNSPIAWIAGRHIKGEKVLGNVLRVDGSVDMWTPLPELLTQNDLAAVRLAIP
jgi:hypothetical protein